MIKSNVLVIGLCAGLVACGGGSSSGDSSGSQDQTANQTGVFLDSPVVNIGYRTETLEGFTNSLGEYDYVEGETVTFFIGDLEFPSVLARGVVTPAEIGGGAGTTTAINILQILQSLDSDGNPSNGISIFENADGVFTGVGAGLDVTSATFDDEVEASLANISSGLTLVSEVDAAAHFAETQQARLPGSWVFEEGTNQRNVLSFIDDTRYVIFHEHDDGESQTAGSGEYGTYAWDVAEGTMAFVTNSESDGRGGLNSRTASVELLDDTLTLGLSDGTATFTRVSDESNELVGGRLFPEPNDDNDNVLTILNDSEYAIFHTNNQTGQALSGEFGTYTYVDGVFSVTGITVDTDGEGGLSSIGGGLFSGPVPLRSDGSLEFNPDTEVAFTFEKL
jgi:hypothetical protein